MNQLMPQSKRINWNKGLHRVFALLCVLWMGFVFVWYPMDKMNKAAVYAHEIRMHGLDAMSKGIMSYEEVETEYKENRERVSWNYAYENYVFGSGFFLSILFIVLIPAIFYAITRLLIFLILWLYRGFKTTKEGT